MAVIPSLQALLVDEIKELYHVEASLAKALPKLANAAANDRLRLSFRDHQKQTKIHILRLMRVAKLLGTTPAGRVSRTGAGLIDEAEAGSRAAGPDGVRDAHLIGHARRIEHFEIAAYGTARAFAQKLGETEVAVLLQETLEEEGEADKALVEIARHVLDEAANAGEEPGGATD